MVTNMKSSFSITCVLVAVLVILLVAPAIEAGQICATCTGADIGDACHTHSTCNDTEVCQMMVYTDEGGQVLQDYGCAMPQRCTHAVDPILVGRRSDTIRHDICNVCCNSSAICNDRLSCDITAPTQTGQTCATCTGTVSGSSCHAHSVCSDHEVCQMIVYTNEMGQILHDYGCALPQVCFHSVSFFIVGRSSNSVHHGLCNLCCNDTRMCNQKLACDVSGSTPASLPMECSDLSVPSKTNGTYTIYPYGTLQYTISVRCEFDSDGNAWTVIQRRINGSVNFYRDWQSYKNGFGSAYGEYWIGNDILHQLTSHAHTSLRVVMSDFDGATKHADYSTFHVGDERSGYLLHVDGYTGNAGDGLAVHNGNQFSTFDRDNDHDSVNCAQYYDGAWWYNACHKSNLNGLYLAGHHESSANGVNWFYWRGHNYSLKTATMMIRKT